MRRHARIIGFSVLLGIAFYLPLEDFVLRWLPLSLGPLTVLRQLPEVLVWLVALTAAALHLTRHGTIRVIGHRIDRFLIGFVVVAITTMFLNGADFFRASVSLKALLRYIPLIYALIMLAPDKEQLARVPRVIIAAFCVQLTVGLAEWLGGQPVRAFFSVVHAWGGFSFIGEPLGELRMLEQHDVNGTMGRPIAFAYFILIGLIVWIVHYEKKKLMYALGVGLALLATFQSHSRMAVFATVLIVVLHQLSVRGVGKTLWLTLVLIPVAAAVSLSLGSSLTEHLYFLDVFSQEYREHALTQRLGLIVNLLPNIFNGGITLFGYSSDATIVAAGVAEHFSLPQVLSYVFVVIVEDVYWLALLLYYGFVGFALFALFFGKLGALSFRLFRHASNNTAKQHALAALLVVIICVPLNGINQTFEVRQFSYYLWLLIGVSIAAARNAAPNTGLSLEESP